MAVAMITVAAFAAGAAWMYFAPWPNWIARQRVPRAKARRRSPKKGQACATT